MATKSEIRWQQRVDRPYQHVHDTLSNNAAEILKQATAVAKQCADSDSADLHSRVAGFEFHQDVVININSYTEITKDSGDKMIIDLEWKSASESQLLPVMHAKVHVSPLDQGQVSMIDFRGEYEPPLGILGQAFDTVIGHRVAEESVQHLLEELAQYLETEIKPT